MSLTSGLLMAWMLGVLGTGGLITYKVLHPTARMRKALEPLKGFPKTAVVFIFLIALTWFVSVPVLYYQSYRDEKREAGKL